MKSSFDVICFKPMGLFRESYQTTEWEIYFIKRLRRNHVQLDGFCIISIDKYRIFGSHNLYNSELSKRIVKHSIDQAEREEAMKHLATVHGYFVGLLKAGGYFEK